MNDLFTLVLECKMRILAIEKELAKEKNLLTILNDRLAQEQELSDKLSSLLIGRNPDDLPSKASS
jgi:uncharacterized coiled-coil protein SlyX